jgi:hypothetical protein
MIVSEKLVTCRGVARSAGKDQVLELLTENAATSPPQFLNPVVHQLSRLSYVPVPRLHAQ